MLNPACDRTPLTPGARLRAVSLLSATALAVAGAALTAAPVPVVAADVAPAGPRAAVATALSPSAQRPIARDAAVAQAAATLSGRGSLSGTVVDQLGGVVPGTELTLTSAATGGALVTIADGRGSFEFRDVRAGQYTLQARLPGFQSLQTVVTVAADAAHTRTLTLQLGSLSETITVVGERGASAAEPTRPAAPAARAPSPSEAAQRDIEDRMARVVKAMEAARRGSAFRAGSVGGQIQQPYKISDTRPIYPASAQAAGIEGLVQLAARIGVDGHVVEAVLSREADANPPVHPDLVDAAIAAVRQWKFSPTLLNGVPVEVNMRVSVSFSLR